MLKFSPLPLDKADCVWLPNQFCVRRSPFKSFRTLGLENYTGNTFATETCELRAFLITSPSLSFLVELQVISVCLLWRWGWCNDKGANQGLGGLGCWWSKTALGKNPWSNYRFKGEKDSHVVNLDIPQGRANKMKNFCAALLLVGKWGERLRCWGEEWEEEELQDKGEIEAYNIMGEQGERREGGKQWM